MPARNKVFKRVPQIYRFMELLAPFTDWLVFMLAFEPEVGYTMP